MEPVFQGTMADNKKFHAIIKNKIEKKEAFMALHRMENFSLMGIIAFSKEKNCISWFGVFGKNRRKGIGSALLECALIKLDHKKDIEVITFKNDHPHAVPVKKDT